MSPRISLDAREQYFQERREQILDAAMKVFGRKGFAGANVSDIAKEAAIGKGTLYLYFKSKEEIFNSLLAEHSFIPHLADHISRKDETLREMLTHIGLDYLNRRQEYLPLIRIAISELYRFPEYADKIYEQVIRAGSEMLASLFSEKIREGKLQLRKDPYLMAQAFFGMLVTYVISQELLGGKKIHVISVEDWVDEMVDVFLKGIENS